jgi:hypothetical protein
MSADTVSRLSIISLSATSWYHEKFHCIIELTQMGNGTVFVEVFFVIVILTMYST